jgi:hypothetical protein
MTPTADDMERPTLRCDCKRPVPRVVNDHTIDCETCKGWFAVSVSTREELDAFFHRFAP